MADGKPPPPPLSPHEEGENLNTNVNFSKPKLHAINSSISSVSNKEPPKNQSLLPQSILFPIKIGEAFVPLPSFPSPSSISHHTNCEIKSYKPPSSTPTLYADVVKGKDASLSVKESEFPNLTLITQNSTFQGKPAVLFSSMAKTLLVKRCELVLVGKFSHGRPSLRSINLFFVKLKLKEIVNITFFDSKHIFLECSCKEDFYRIWMGLVWSIEGLAMRVFKWSPEFSPLKESSIAPVWITVAGLPLYMFEESALLSVGKAVGNPIRIDPRNINRSVVNNAWICIELDVLEPLVTDVWVSFVDENGNDKLDGFWLKIFYEVVPPFCTFCHHIGHTTALCKRRQEQVIHVLPDMKNASLIRLDDNNINKKDNPAAHKSEASYINLNVEKKGADFVGIGDGQLGSRKDELQLDGMLVNKLLLGGSHITSSKTTVKPFVGKQSHRQTKIYQAKTQPLVSTVSLEVKNSFSVLEEDVLIEDLTLEEGELPVADVCAAAIVRNHVSTEVMSAEDGPEAGNARSAESTPEKRVVGSSENVVLAAFSAGQTGGATACSAAAITAIHTGADNGSETVEEAAASSAAETASESVITAAEKSDKGSADTTFTVEVPAVREQTLHELQDATVGGSGTAFAGVSGGALETDARVCARAVLEIVNDSSHCRGVLKHIAPRVLSTSADDVAEFSVDASAEEHSDAAAGRIEVSSTTEQEQAAREKQQECLVPGKVEVLDLGAQSDHHAAGSEADGTQFVHNVEGDFCNHFDTTKKPALEQNFIYPYVVEEGEILEAVSKDTQQGAGAAREGYCWADLVEEEHGKQLAREHNDILEWDAAQVKAFVHKQIEEIKQEIGQIEPKIRDATKQAKKVKKERERNNLKAYFMASAEKINSDLERKRSEQKGKTSGNSGEG